MKAVIKYMKKINIILSCFLCILLTACVKDNDKPFHTPSENNINDGSEKIIHDDLTVEHIKYINISGNARSIVIKQSENSYIQFYNADLNKEHTYEVHCDEHGDTLDIAVIMESTETHNTNNVLGSVIITIPQKEFENITLKGEFSSMNVSTLHSDVTIHANDSYVNLDLESNYLDHNFTLFGTESNTFKGVSIYFDEIPDHVTLDLNLMKDGVLNDPQNILENNGFKEGSGKPKISVNDTKEINIYIKE